MKEYDDYSAKEQQQLAVCQRLISEKLPVPVRRFRRDLQNEGFEGISQVCYGFAPARCWAQ